MATQSKLFNLVFRPWMSSPTLLYHSIPPKPLDPPKPPDPARLYIDFIHHLYMCIVVACFSPLSRPHLTSRVYLWLRRRQDSPSPRSDVYLSVLFKSMVPNLYSGIEIILTTKPPDSSSDSRTVKPPPPQISTPFVVNPSPPPVSSSPPCILSDQSPLRLILLQSPETLSSPHRHSLMG